MYYKFSITTVILSTSFTYVKMSASEINKKNFGDATRHMLSTHFRKIVSDSFRNTLQVFLKHSSRENSVSLLKFSKKASTN